VGGGEGGREGGRGGGYVGPKALLLALHLLRPMPWKTQGLGEKWGHCRRDRRQPACATLPYARLGGGRGGGRGGGETDEFCWFHFPSFASVSGISPGLQSFPPSLPPSTISLPSSPKTLVSGRVCSHCRRHRGWKRRRQRSFSHGNVGVSGNGRGREGGTEGMKGGGKSVYTHIIYIRL